MIKHIVFFTLKPHAEGRPAHENALEMKARLEALNGRIDGLLMLEVGVDFSRTDASADVALYSEFADRASLDAYQVHPEHVAIATWVGGLRESRTIADYEV